MKKIKVQTTINSTIEKVWKCWNDPQHITKWAFASADWGCPHAENDLRNGGKFLTRMAARDGSASFDITGVYTSVLLNEHIAYTMDDGRTVSVTFTKIDEGHTSIDEEFEMENENSEELQRSGWQAILDNFKKHTEMC
jgi:uncharacterized protein YndB with AHSA1/START domain